MSWLDSIVAVLFIASIAYVIFYAYATVTGLIDAFKGVIKESKVLAPHELSDCPEGREKSGLLCYKKCDKGGRTEWWNRIAATCWLKEVGVGIGKIPGKKPCDPGQRDDLTSCWEDAKCSTRECGRLRGLFGEDWGPKLCTECGGCGCIKKNAFDRYDCPGKDLIDGLCYDKCPNGMEHIPGAPTYCRPIGVTETSYTPTDDPGVPMTCPKGQVQSGALCYDDPGPGWKVVAGVAWKDCPAGSKDGGAICIPAGMSGDAPWYLSFYMLLTACGIIVACIIYWRLKMMYSIVTGSGRRRTRKSK